MYLSSINVGLFNNFNDVILLLPSSTIYLLLSSLGVTMIKSTGLRPLVTISSTREYNLSPWSSTSCLSLPFVKTEAQIYNFQY